MRSFARVNEAKIVRSRETQCHADRGITLTPTTEDTNFYRREGAFHSQLELDWMISSVDRNRKFSKHIFSTPAIFKATNDQAFQLTELL